MRRAQILLLVVSACGGSSSAPPATPTPAPARVKALRSPNAPIDLRPVTITFGGLPIARLLADGRTESVGPNQPASAKFNPGPTLRADGTILLTKPGLTARIDAEGQIYVINPPGTDPAEQLFGKITGNRLTLGAAGDGMVKIDDATLSFDREGGGPEIGKLEGAVDDGMRRTALLMTAVFFIEMSLSR
ncbi:MAG: hypothetical protein WKG01_25330 [Kofleriaceae bacterium]